MFLFSPDHFVYDSSVGLNDPNDFCRDVFIGVIRNGDPVITCVVHSDRRFHSLQERFFIDACQDEVALIQRLGTFRRGADADGRERVSHRQEER